MRPESSLYQPFISAQRLCVMALITPLTALGLSVPSASAWTPLGATWPNLPVPYEINTSSSQELGADTSVSVIQASYDTWSDPSCSGFRVQYRGTTSNNWRSGDGVNTHQWIYSSNQRPAELGGRETIGVTLSLYRGSSLVDGDILYNGIDHRWSTNPSRSGQVDAQSIITHEIGHQLGLGHTLVNGATMYPSYAGGTGPRTLSQDDIEGVCSLYPGSGAPECTRTADCADGLECVNGSCVQVNDGEGQIGDSCLNSPCSDGLVCVQGQDNNAFCTRICSDGQCPGGWGCFAVNSNQGQVNICLPANDTGDSGFGDNCSSGQECSSGLCVSDGQRAFCSQSCTQDAECPGSATCEGLSNGGGACLPSGEPNAGGGFGDECGQASDCDSELCLDTGEDVYCTEQCQGDDDCPRGAGCFDAGQINVCAWREGEDVVDPPAGGEDAPSGAQYGDACDAPSDCVEMLCLSDGMDQFCSRYCSVASDCPDGDLCVGIGNGQGGCLPNSAPEEGGEMSPGGDAVGGETGGDVAGGGAMGGAGVMGGAPTSGDTVLDSAGDDLSGDGGEMSGKTTSSGCQMRGDRPSMPLSLLLLLMSIAFMRLRWAQDR